MDNSKLKLVSTLLLALMLALGTSALGACSTPQTPTAGESAASTARTAVETTEVADDEAYKNEPAYGRTINIGYDGGLCQGVVAIAHEKGFFADQGLDTQLVKTDNSRDAIAAGKLDTAAGMIAVWLKPISTGVDIVFTNGLHTGCTSAIVLTDSPIQALADVPVGDTIAISGGIGGQFQNIAFRFLAHDGLSQDDYKWADFTMDQGLAVLERGEATVYVGPDQVVEKWVQEGSVRRIRSLDFDEDFKDEACCVMGISGEFYRENPQISARISTAIYNAAAWLDESDENKAEAAQILIDGSWISTTPEYAVDLFKLYEWNIDNARTEKSLYDAVDEYKQLGILDENVDVEALKAQIWKPLELTN